MISDVGLVGYQPEIRLEVVLANEAQIRGAIRNGPGSLNGEGRGGYGQC